MANTIKMQIQFRRDTTANWETYKDMIPAAGEPCFDLELGTLKIGDGIKSYGELEYIGSGVTVSADGKSIVLDDDVFKLSGFDAAEVGAQPRKNADGFIEWVVPSTETLDGLQIAVDALQEDVSTLQSIVGIAEGEVGATLLDRVHALEAGVDILNGDKNTDGSVRKIVNDEINLFAGQISDDGTVNTLKELINYVANHGGELETIVGDISTLQTLVGSEPVADQISNAVSGKVDAEEGKSLVADSLIAKLESISEDALDSKIESISVGGTLLDIVEKGVNIPIATSDTLGVVKGSDEIDVADDGTLTIKSINFSKIVQEENMEIVLSGGGAAG